MARKRTPPRTGRAKAKTTEAIHDSVNGKHDFQLHALAEDIVKLGLPKITWTRWANLESMLADMGIKCSLHDAIPIADIDYEKSKENTSRVGLSPIVAVNVRTMQINSRKFETGLDLPPLLVSRQPDGSLLVHDGFNRLCFLIQNGITHCPAYEMIDAGPEQAKTAGDRANTINGIGNYEDARLALATQRYFARMVPNTDNKALKEEIALHEGVSVGLLSGAIATEETKRKLAPGGSLYRAELHGKLKDWSYRRLSAAPSEAALGAIVDYLCQLPRIRTDTINILVTAANTAKKKSEKAQIAAITAAITRSNEQLKIRQSDPQAALIRRLEILDNDMTMIFSKMDARDYFTNPGQRQTIRDRVDSLLAVFAKMRGDLE
jgi:hypothetical protein